MIDDGDDLDRMLAEEMQDPEFAAAYRAAEERAAHALGMDALHRDCVTAACAWAMGLGDAEIGALYARRMAGNVHRDADRCVGQRTVDAFMGT